MVPVSVTAANTPGVFCFLSETQVFTRSPLLGTGIAFPSHQRAKAPSIVVENNTKPGAP